VARANLDRQAYATPTMTNDDLESRKLQPRHTVVGRALPDGHAERLKRRTDRPSDLQAAPMASL